MSLFSIIVGAFLAAFVLVLHIWRIVSGSFARQIQKYTNESARQLQTFASGMFSAALLLYASNIATENFVDWRVFALLGSTMFVGVLSWRIQARHNRNQSTASINLGESQ